MKILILVLSSDHPPYDKMMQTAMETWDSVEVEDMQTVFYCARSTKQDTDKVIYLDVDKDLYSIGRKTVAALEWTLNNREFDYIARVHASIYVDKIKLREYISTLPESVFAGVETDSHNGFRYCWGGVGYIISRDIVTELVANKNKWVHIYMEDESMSKLAGDLGIDFYPLKAGGIDFMTDHWRCISYHGESISFSDFSDLKRLGHHYYRVKQDGNRKRDEFVMRELFRVL